MRNKDSISFQSMKLKSLTPAIKRKQEDLRLLTQDNIVLKKENNKLKEEIDEQKLDLDGTKEQIKKEKSDWKAKELLLVNKIQLLEEDYNTKKNKFSTTVITKREELDVIEDKTEQLEKQIQPILEVELKAFNIEKVEIEKELKEIKKQEKESLFVIDKANKDYADLVLKTEKQLDKLDKKLEEVSLRESGDKKLHNTLLIHARRINKIYQKLGRDKLVITI